MIYVFPMYGLGGRIWSWPIEDYVAAELRKISGVKVSPTRGYSQWESIANEIASLSPGAKVVTLGHSMGAGSATYVTDRVKVDLVVCYDCAGQSPSYIGNNTGKLLDFWDRSFALVPKFRPKAINGHKHKIAQYETRDGHTGQPRDQKLLRIVTDEINKLKG
jgi:hypothetical protein